MKKRIIPAIVVFACLIAAGCGKEKQCICYYDNVDAYYEKYIFVGPGLNCSDISEVSYENRVTTEEGSHTLQRSDIHQVHCRDAHNI